VSDLLVAEVVWQLVSAHESRERERERERDGGLNLEGPVRQREAGVRQMPKRLQFSPSCERRPIERESIGLRALRVDRKKCMPRVIGGLVN
jgi:hypothetical protein